MTIVMAIMKFFGKKEGQSLQAFAQEIKELTSKDKKELAEDLSKHYGQPVTI